MNNILIATANKHKLEEFKKILPSYLNIRSLIDYPELPDIAETGTSFAANAMIKASTLHTHTGMATIADDSGLSVDALQGAPGIYSARYAGINATDAENRRKLLHNLKGKEPRSAAFFCAIALVGNQLEKIFEGTLQGVITHQEKGDYGFGYDAIFIPEGYNITLAEMEPEIKNRISHRYHAVTKLMKYLQRHPLR